MTLHRTGSTPLRALKFSLALAAGFSVQMAAAQIAEARAEPASASGALSYQEAMQMRTHQAAHSALVPHMRITSPLAGAGVARGEGLFGAGSTRGVGFAITLEVFTRDPVPVEVHEATQTPDDPGIRHADQLGQPNPEFPGLYVFVDQPLIKPDGTLIPAHTNLAALFNIAGSDDTPGVGVTVWAGWHILESLPPQVDTLKISAAVVDAKGRIGFDEIQVAVTDRATSGAALTPDPASYPGAGTLDAAGPKVEIVAPRVPSAIAIGEQEALPDAETGTLHFIQVDILDLAGAGIALDEVGDTVTAPEFGPGSITDPSQLGVASNRNFPGLHFSFDVPLQAPNGVLVPAGGNVAPVFNIVGSSVDSSTGAVRIVADWVVGGSLIVPEDKAFVRFTATVTDNLGKAGSAQRHFLISEVSGGQLLTPAP